MSFVVGIGTSQGANAFKVGHEAALFATHNLGKTQPHMALLFASSRYDEDAVLKGVKSVTGVVPLVGCSSAGEITPSGPESRSVVVTLISSDNLKCALGLGQHVSKNAREAGQRSAREANIALQNQAYDDIHERSTFVIFPDGISGNGDDIIRGIQEIFGTSFPIVGGSSGDDFAFKRTYQFFKDEVLSDSVVGVLLGGNISVGIGISHGWRPLGKPRLITRAFANVIMEIDGEPAVNIYKDYFGSEAEEWGKEPLAKFAVLYPLGICVAGENEFLIRTAIKIEKGGSLVCAGEILEGSLIRLMMGSRESALEAATKAAQDAIANLGHTTPKIALIFDSISRNKLLGRDTRKELALIKKEFGREVPMVGFYAYGEQAPLKTKLNIGQSYFHNGAIVVLLMGE